MNGKNLKENHTFMPEFFEQADYWEKKFQYAAENMVLPEKPDWKRIEDFVTKVNRNMVLTYNCD